MSHSKSQIGEQMVQDHKNPLLYCSQVPREHALVPVVPQDVRNEVKRQHHVLGRDYSSLPYSLQLSPSKNPVGHRHPRYLSISCHEWTCTCAYPKTVRRYNMSTRDASSNPRAPNTYTRGFMLPEACPVKSRNHLREQDGAAGEAKPERKASVTDIAKLLPIKKQAKEVRRQLEENRRRRHYEEMLSCKPVSVKGAFRVSIPHWQNARYTQRWLWQSRIKSQNWSLRDPAKENNLLGRPQSNRC